MRANYKIAILDPKASGLRRIVAEIFSARDIIFAFSGGIAQLVERLVRNEKARGSNPLTSTFRFAKSVPSVAGDLTPKQYENASVSISICHVQP